MASIVKKTNSNRILFYVFILAVFVDAANGILQKKVGITTPIGIMYRGTLFYYFFLYLFKSKYKTLIGLLIFLVLICLFCWVAFYNAIVPKEIEYLIRYSYFFVFLNFFCLKRNCFDAESVYKHILMYGLLIPPKLKIAVLLQRFMIQYHQHLNGRRSNPAPEMGCF